MVINALIDPAVSGYRPIVASEKTMMELSNIKLPTVPALYEQHNSKIRTYVFAFDGTENDRNIVNSINDQETVVFNLHKTIADNSKLNLHPSIIGKYNRNGASGESTQDSQLDCRDNSNQYVASPLRICYSPGAGKQQKWFVDKLDSIFGLSTERIANSAFDDLQQWAESNPPPLDGELRVVAIGFSRGAVAARHFLNLLYEKNLVDGQAKVKKTNAAIWSYALLFDTVPTFNSHLKLGIPPNVKHLVHFVAKHERRKFFTPLVDEDDGYRDPLGQKRISTVYVSGAHSDIGDGYALSAGHFLRLNAQYFLSQLGLSLNVDAATQQKANLGLTGTLLTDSRGWLDRLKSTSQPYGCGSNLVHVERDEIRQNTLLTTQQRQLLESNQSGTFDNFIGISEYTSRRIDSLKVKIPPHFSGRLKASHPAIRAIEIGNKKDDSAVRINIAFKSGLNNSYLLPDDYKDALNTNGGDIEISFAGTDLVANNGASLKVPKLISIYLNNCLIE